MESTAEFTASDRSETVTVTVNHMGSMVDLQLSRAALELGEEDLGATIVDVADLAVQRCRLAHRKEMEAASPNGRSSSANENGYPTDDDVAALEQRVNAAVIKRQHQGQ